MTTKALTPALSHPMGEGARRAAEGLECRRSKEAHCRAAAIRGFTLIEIMVSLFILAIIVAAVYSSWAAIVRGSKTALQAAAEVQRSRIAIRTLENSLASARMFVADADYYSFIAENGSDASLSFVARLPDSFPRGGRFGDFNTRRLTFSLESGNGSQGSQKELVLRQTPVLMDMDKDEKNHPIVLARNVKDFEMGFWDERAGDWVDEWNQTNQIPKLIKVTLKFGGDNAQSKMEEDVTRVIAPASVAVQPNWQRPGAPPGPAAGGPHLVIPSPGR